MADNEEKSTKFDPKGEMGPFLRMIKVEIEDAASEAGKLLVDNRFIGPLRKNLDSSILKLLSHGIKLGGGRFHFKKEWFQSQSTYLLANEIADSLFSGIAKAIEKPWKPGEPGEIDYMEFRGEFDRRLRALNCIVIQDKQRDTYHFEMCGRAPKGKTADKCSRFHAELMGRSPDRRCCAGVFEHYDAKARFEQPGNLERALQEAGPEIADEFMDWLTGLSQGQRWEIKPWLDSIERGDNLEVIHRMLAKQAAERREAVANLDEEMLSRPPDEREEIPEEDLVALDEAHWQEMRIWIQGSIPRKADKFFTIESAQRYWEKVKLFVKEHDREVAQVVDHVNAHAEARLRRIEGIRDRARRDRDRYFRNKERNRR